MNDKVLIVTPPDDVLEDGLRLMLFDLTPQQSHIVSEALKRVEIPNTIVYVGNSKELDWTLDKKLKSSIIVFNADSEDQLMTGYLAAQANSYYFGILRLSNVNKKAIYNIEQFISVLEEYV